MSETPNHSRPLAVLGAGPVGTILASDLCGLGERLLLVETSAARREQIAAGGLRVEGAGLTAAALMPGPVLTLLSALSELRGTDPWALLVCTKAYSLAEVAPILARVLPADTLVVCLQNGVGPEDQLLEHLPPQQVARGVVNFAGNLDHKTGLVHLQWFNPPNVLGPARGEGNGRLRRLAALWDRAGLTCEVVDEAEIRRRAFFKTILSAALNALCATSGITMREAMAHSHTRSLARLLLREGLSVAAAVGYAYGEDALERCMRYLESGGDHLPSMWSDLVHNRPTEIDYINGRIAQIGLGFKHLDVGANIFFTAAVITQEIKSGVRSPDDIPVYLRRF